jgi:putative ABC transport system permease protein
VDVRLHLPDLQALLGGDDQVDSIIVRLRHSPRATILATHLNASGLGFRAYTSSDLARRNSSTFQVIAQFHRAIGLVTILASGAFLLTIMTLKGEEMRRQVGLLRLVGISHRTVAGTILLVASGVALLGSGLGIGLGYLLSWTINAYYRSLFATDLLFSRVTLPLVALAGALSIALGLAAGAATLWRFLRRSPMDQVGR